MAKDLTTLLAQKPSWIGIEEPVSGSTDPASQDATVQIDGTVTSNVEGVDNRCTAHLWGLLKLFADILDYGHNDDGSHTLLASDIDASAGIEESKLDLNIYSAFRPDNGNPYTSTTDISDLLTTLWPYQIRSLRNAQIDYSEQYRTRLAFDKLTPTSWETEKHLLVPNVGLESELIIADDEYVWISGYRVRLNGTNSVNTSCLLNIGEASGRSGTPSSMSDQGFVTIEMWEHNITQADYAFPFGNTQFRNTNESGTHGLAYDHSDQGIETTHVDFDDFVSDPDNNVFFNNDAELMQMVYRIRYFTTDYILYKNGLDDINYRTLLNNLSVVPSTRFQGCWESVDGEIITLPMLSVSRRNKGVYHEAYNPAGTAFLRSGVIIPTNFSQCFQHSNIAYYSNTSVECPDYTSAVYDSANDLYTLASIEYYRTGNNVSINTAHPLGYYNDILIPDDILSLKRNLAYIDTAINHFEHIMYSGLLETQLMPVHYGTVSSTSIASHFSKQPYQILGFGDTESNVFGTNNVGGVFIDETNNGLNGETDEARRCWIDKACSIYVSWNFTENQSNDESKPTLVTYEPTSGTITLNTTGLSAQPLIKDENPILTWENGDLVTLSSSWTGLGTQSGSAVIDSTDKTNHSGQKVYGLSGLDYLAGSGTPYLLKNVLKIKDHLGYTHPHITVYDEAEHEVFEFLGALTTGSTDTIMYLDNTASSLSTDYVGSYIMLLSMNEWRKIISYDGATKQAVLDSPLLGGAPSPGELITIAKVESTVRSTIIIDTLSRGINSAIRRVRFIANVDGVATVDRHIRSTSHGTIQGSTVVGLVSGQEIDVLYDAETPFSSVFKLYMTHKPQFTQFTSIDVNDSYKIMKTGNLLTTNIGTANDPNLAYLLMSPNYMFPDVDNITWIGTTETNLTTSINELKDFAWNQIIPHEGLSIRASDMTVDFDIGEGRLELSSPSELTDPNSGIFIGSMLVKSKNTGRYFYMVSLKSDGYFGFDASSNIFLLEVNTTFAVTTN